MYQQIRKNYRQWWLCELFDRDKMRKPYKEPSIDALYQILIHLAKRFF